jgi:hypothetical protein
VLRECLYKCEIYLHCISTHLINNNHGGSVSTSLPDVRRSHQLGLGNATVADALEVAAKCGASVDAPLLKRPRRILPVCIVLNCEDGS